MPTRPIIVPADATTAGNNTAATPWSVSHPNASAGDLLLFHIAWDDSVTTTSVTPPSGPNGETITAINSTPAASASTEARGQAFYTIATGAWTAGTIDFTPSASESFTASCIHVPAGEFDPTTPIGAQNTNASSGTAESNVQSAAFTAGSTDGGGTLVFFGIADADPQTVGGSGWTAIIDGGSPADIGAVSLSIAVRDAATTNSETISAVTVSTITSDSWCSVGYIIRPNPVDPIAASEPITFATSAALRGWSNLDTYTASPQFTVASGTSAITGTAAVTAASTAMLTGTGALAGTGAAVFGSTAALTADGALAGSSVLTFAATGSISAPGVLAGSSAITFADGSPVLRGWLNLDTYTVTPQITIESTLSGSLSIAFDSAASISGGTTISGSADVVFSETAALTAIGTLVGSSDVAFANAAVIQSIQSIVGTTAITFADGTPAIRGWSNLDTYTVTPQFTVEGGMLGTVSISFGHAATLDGSGILAGSSDAVFALSGLMLAPGSTTGTTSITIGETAALSGIGTLATSTAITFGQTATLDGWGALDAYDVDIDGTVDPGGLAAAPVIVFTNSATLTGTGTLAGICSVAFDAASTLFGKGDLIGSSQSAFATSGTLDQAGSMSAVASILFSSNSIVVGSGALSGAIPLVFGASSYTGVGSLGSAQERRYQLHSRRRRGYYPP